MPAPLPPDLQRDLLTIVLPWLGDSRGDIKLLLGPGTRDGIAWGDGVSARKLGDQLLDHATLSEWQAIVSEIRLLDDSADRLTLIDAAISRLNTLRAKAPSAASAKPRFNTVKLREILSRTDFADLRKFCADLNVEYDNIVGESSTISVAALAIVEYFSRRDALTALVRRVRQAFPAAEWLDVASSEDLPGIAFNESGGMTSQAHIGGADQLAVRPPGPLRVFLCHSRPDKKVARSLHTWLLAQGAQPWLDEIDLLPGQDWREEIRDAVQRSDVVLVCISQQSLNREGFVRDEIAYALNQAERMPRNAVYLVPLRIDDCEAPERLARWHWLDWFETGWEERLRRTLQHRASSLNLALSPIIAIPAPPLRITTPFEMQFVHVPSGNFLMGSDPKRDKNARDNEKPQHTVYLDAFEIGRHPVTNAQWAVYADAVMLEFDPPKGKMDHPVVNVSWHEATQFCDWLTKISGTLVRLPTEAEWEKAARGTDGRIYPWDDQAPDKERCNIAGWFKGTTPVGQFSPIGDSPYEAADMAGNVWEWCLDQLDDSVYNRRAKSTVRNPLISKAEFSHHVLRGGSWVDLQSFARAAYRSVGASPNFRFSNFGFRVVSAPVPSPQ